MAIWTENIKTSFPYFSPCLELKERESLYTIFSVCVSVWPMCAQKCFCWAGPDRQEHWGLQVALGPRCRCPNPLDLYVFKWKSHMAPTLSQKLEIIMLSEEGILESQDRLKAWPLEPVSQVVNGKKKLLKEIKSATQVSAQMIRKRNSHIADMEEVLVI